MVRSNSATILLAVALATAGVNSSVAAKSPKPRLTPHQARQLAALVAHHDDIDLSDTHIEMNSMDVSTDFAPGFFSFIVIRESITPGPDETLRRYAINRHTGDVWEMTLCTHYDFPELERMQHAFAGRTGINTYELSFQEKQLGCTDRKSKPTL
jgi:hypothetical protein